MFSKFNAFKYTQIKMYFSIPIASSTAITPTLDTSETLDKPDTSNIPKPLFLIILGNISEEDWEMYWTACRSMILTMTLKEVRNFLTDNNIRFPTIIYTKEEFWNNNEFLNNIIKLDETIIINRGFKKMKKMSKAKNLNISYFDSDIFSFLIHNLIKISQDMNQFDFSNNYKIFGVDEIIQLIKLLRNYPNLECLDLGNNILGDDGARAFAEALLLSQTHHKLVNLNVSECMIGQTRAEILVKMRKQCSTLMFLDLKNNYYWNYEI